MEKYLLQLWDLFNQSLVQSHFTRLQMEQQQDRIDALVKRVQKLEQERLPKSKN